MPTQWSKAVIEAAILGFEDQKRQIDEQIAELRGTRSGETRTDVTKDSPAGTKPRKKFSAATRRAMAAAQQRRWAAKKAEGVTSEVKPAATKPCF